MSYSNMSKVWKRLASTGRPAVADAIPKRPLKKIQVGKARPAIYHKFECHVQLSDGSVITRRSQYPKEEFRMLADQRNNPLWNESRADLFVGIDTKGRISQFREKYAAFDTSSPVEGDVETKAGDSAVLEGLEDFTELMDGGYVEQKLGGNIMNTKSKGGKRK
ncbi:unnamed protein product [Kuraishia capsulata CBS 1993]|uniref:Ribosomal protein bL31m N-terminal domain-containing protein n=1 Tax=Kuraishia capsulata CBS 1993 TaxID=1382522 RepID=W6MF11_9ASCO|nr:uncharacterized protein KUCA_T00000039001 [Kuraishia capsulata CBS 1993]CDK24079.1 unnamed protein product [Kuraishia capsulata CBS 1993]